MTKNQLYTIDVRVFADKEKFDKAYSAMPRARREAIDRYRFDADKRLSLGAGILTDFGLNRLGISGYEIKRDDNGKPFVDGHPEVHFNLSHSGDYAICAFSDRPVGADIERIREFKPSVIKRVFSEDERAFAESMAEKMNTASFSGSDPFEEPPAADAGCFAPPEMLYTLLWTVKESYVKYTGKGIASDLRRITPEDLKETDRFAPGQVCTLRIRAAGEDAGPSCLVTCFVFPGYCISICSADTESREPFAICPETIIL